MAFYLVANGQIMGDSSTQVDALPDGWQCIEGPELADPYFDGEAIQPKPAQPSQQHRWNLETHQWELPAMPTPVIVEDWKGLENDLRGSDVYAKLYTAITQPETNTIAALTKMMRANAAYTLLMTTITTTHALPDFYFAITELRTVLGTISTIGDFSSEQIAFINQKLEDRGFSLRLD